MGSAALGLHERAVQSGHGTEDSIALLRLREEEFGQEARRHIARTADRNWAATDQGLR